MLRSGSVVAVAMVSVAGLAGLVTGAGVAASPEDGPVDGVTRRVSVGAGWAQANGDSTRSVMSAGGRYVAFYSEASNLVPGDTNDLGDVFVRDRVAHVTRRVSVGPGGIQANDSSPGRPAISANGRYVAFFSFASNLVPRDTNDLGDVFVRDRVAHLTRRVSVGPRDAQSSHGGYFDPAISANGRYVAFSSGASDLVPGDTNDLVDAFVRDRRAHVTWRVSVGRGSDHANDGSLAADISANGRYVVFYTVEGPDFAAGEVFVRDRRAHRTWRVSVGLGGDRSNGLSIAGKISAGGRYVAFSSDASNLVPGDTNDLRDAFVRDRRAHVTRRVSVGPGGAQANGFVQGFPVISADGRYVAFSSTASNLVAGDTNNVEDVFVRDRVAHVTRRVSVGLASVQAMNFSTYPATSANGRFVSFLSFASNLVPGDTNDVGDVFVRKLFN